MWSIETWEKLSTALKAAPESSPATGSSAVRHILGCRCEKDSNKHVSCEFSQNSSICILRNWEHMWFSGKTVWKWPATIPEGYLMQVAHFCTYSSFVFFNQYELFFWFSFPPVAVTFPLAVLSTVQSFKPWGTKYHLTETETSVSIKPLWMTLRSLHFYSQ